MAAYDDDNQDESQLLCGWLPWTPVVKSLVLMTCLTALVMVTQFIFGIKANSKSLLADDATMVVDTFCYFGNIVGEASTDPSRKQKLELLFAFISIVVLIAFNTIFFVQVWSQVSTFFLADFLGDPVAAAELAVDEDDAGDGVNGNIVLFFALVGLVCDIISVYVFTKTQQEEEKKHQLGSLYDAAEKDVDTSMDTERTYEGCDTDSDELFASDRRLSTLTLENTTLTKGTAHAVSVNLISALLHVGADLMRCLSTMVEGIVIIFVSPTPQTDSLIDAIATLSICVTVYVCSAYAFLYWLEDYKSYKQNSRN